MRFRKRRKLVEFRQMSYGQNNPLVRSFDHSSYMGCTGYEEQAYKMALTRHATEVLRASRCRFD